MIMDLEDMGASEIWKFYNIYKNSPSIINTRSDHKHGRHLTTLQTFSPPQYSILSRILFLNYFFTMENTVKWSYPIQISF